MAFQVAARTVLELGAELISSDAVAIFELVKNAIDAQSPDGVTIELCITIRHSDFVDVLDKCNEFARRQGTTTDPRRDLNELRQLFRERLQPSASEERHKAILDVLDGVQSVLAFRSAVVALYREHNWIEFRDTGKGMSHEDLLTAYLVIGTASRRKDLDAALEKGKGKPPFLGEKGVGRLSVMRLGTLLDVQTATVDDARWNTLHVDWSEFEDLDKLIGDVKIAPKLGEPKPTGTASGTTIRIQDLRSNWSASIVRDIASFELSRLWDPFSKDKRRFRVVIVFNGDRVDIPRFDRAILDVAHAKVVGEYSISNGAPKLEMTMSCRDLGNGNQPEERRMLLELVDLRSLTKDSSEIPASALRTVGPFSFELYWYNRQRLRGVDSIGELKRVRELQEQWSGIMLFRDGYRVFPYGDDKDDWLGLDRRALASSGYKLNKAQFIGRVSVSRTANPQLVDQTNREGLKDCDEKRVLVEVVQFVIQNRLDRFLDEVNERQRKAPDLAQSDRQVRTLEHRVQTTIRDLEKKHGAARPQLRELTSQFDEMRDYFAQARERAEQIEDERDRMLQLAGVGLMLEIVAHELARSTEQTMRLLDQASQSQLPADVAALVRGLRDEMKTMNKRLRVLDPLSVSGRQRKETFDLVELVRDVFDGHDAQFRRHGVRAEIEVAGGRPKVLVHGVRGMFVQIVENLLQNSIYWMSLRREEEEGYKPLVQVRLGEPPIVMEFTDNGPGVQPSLREEVFKAFFSTKGKSRRQGLGLYIARDCARHHGGLLYLSDERRVHRHRLNTFVLELPRTER